MTWPSGSSRTVLTLLQLLLLYFACSEYVTVRASVHEYSGDRFVAKGGAFVVHGGSEGIYSSAPSHRNSTSLTDNGDSYIR